MEHYFNLQSRLAAVTKDDHGWVDWDAVEKREIHSAFITAMTGHLMDVDDCDQAEEAAFILDDVIAQAEKYAAHLRSVRFALIAVSQTWCLFYSAHAVL